MTLELARSGIEWLECNTIFLLADNLSNLHRTLLKNGRQPLAAFQKSFVKIREMYKPIRRKRLKFKTE
jgi:hypothetical protein